MPHSRPVSIHDLSVPVVRVLAAHVDALVDLVLPRGCASCGVDGPAVCPACSIALAAAAASGPRQLTAGSRPGRRLACSAAAVYGGTVRSLLLAYKERRRREVGWELASLLATALAAAPGPASARPPRPPPGADGPAGDGVAGGGVAGGGLSGGGLSGGGAAGCGRGLVELVIVPVPSRPSARASRGFDHVARLAHLAAADLRRGGIQARVLPALRLCREPADQSGLGALERRINVAGVFEATSPGPPPARRAEARVEVIVVDDIVTTGATLTAAAAALRSAAWPVRAGAAVAATPLARGRPGPATTRPGQRVNFPAEGVGQV
jgi:predicted amidophosphoribosyltransferase